MIPDYGPIILQAAFGRVIFWLWEFRSDMGL